MIFIQEELWHERSAVKVFWQTIWNHTLCIQKVWKSCSYKSFLDKYWNYSQKLVSESLLTKYDSNRQYLLKIDVQACQKQSLKIYAYLKASVICQDIHTAGVKLASPTENRIQVSMKKEIAKILDGSTAYPTKATYLAPDSKQKQFFKATCSTADTICHMCSPRCSKYESHLYLKI